MKTLKDLWDEAVDLELRVSSLKSVVQNEGSTRTDLQVFNDAVGSFVKDLLKWQKDCNKAIEDKLVASPQSVFLDQLKSGLFKYGVKEWTGLDLYTVEGATEESVLLHAIQRGIQFDCRGEVSLTPAVCEVPFSYFYAEFEVLTRDKLLELTNTKSPLEKTENE